MELRAKEISRRYFRKAEHANVFTALEPTSLTLTGGELVAVLGRSGSGKSTLLNVLAGILRPDSGCVCLDETDLYSLNDAERSRLRNERFGIVPQGQTGLHALTVLENVLLPFTMYEKSRSNRSRFAPGENPASPVAGTSSAAMDVTPEAYALELLEQLGIGKLKNIYPNELSGGELRRLAIARALIRKPDIILADEPTGDLDDENTQNVLTLLRKEADRGAAVLLVTHEKEAAPFADRVFRMANGVLGVEA